MFLRCWVTQWRLQIMKPILIFRRCDFFNILSDCMIFISIIFWSIHQKLPFFFFLRFLFLHSFFLLLFRLLDRLLDGLDLAFFLPVVLLHFLYVELLEGGENVFVVEGVLPVDDGDVQGLLDVEPPNQVLLQIWQILNEEFLVFTVFLGHPEGHQNRADD